MLMVTGRDTSLACIFLSLVLFISFLKMDFSHIRAEVAILNALARNSKSDRFHDR